MKKIKLVILLLIIIIFILLVMNKFHFLYNTACGSGVTGLRLLIVYAGIGIIAFLVFSIVKKSKKKNFCPSCKSTIENGWEICPYCGVSLKERSTIK